MPSVLIVEDDPDVREMMEYFVALAGHDPISAPNGLAALEKLRRHRPCLILLDLHMPVMDGFEFRRKQLEDPELAGVPVLCVTAAYRPEDVARELRLPCVGKPVELAEVSSAISGACGNQHG